MQTLEELNHVLVDLYKKKLTHLKHKASLLRLLLEEKKKKKYDNLNKVFKAIKKEIVKIIED